MTEIPPAKKARLGYREEVAVLVGAQEVRFMVYKATITKHSTFFEAACSERWQKSGSEPIKLPEDDPDSFEMYLDALYRGQVNLDEIDDSAGESGGLFEHTPDIARLMCVWILADKLGDERTTNLVMDCLSQYCVDDIDPSFIAYVYERTSKGSKLRRLIVDGFLPWYNRPSLQKVAENEVTPKVFLSELVLEKARRATECQSGCNRCQGRCDNCHNQVNFQIESRCRYRQHNKQRVCGSTDCENKTAGKEEKDKKSYGQIRVDALRNN